MLAFIMLIGFLFMTPLHLHSEDFILEVEGGENIIITVDDDDDETHCYARYESLEPYLNYELEPIKE